MRKQTESIKQSLTVQWLRKKVKSLSHVQLYVTPWTVAYQGPPSMGFSKQGYWDGFPFPSPGDLSDPGTEPGSPALQTDSLASEPPGKPSVIFKMGTSGLLHFYSLMANIY